MFRTLSIFLPMHLREVSFRKIEIPFYLSFFTRLFWKTMFTKKSLTMELLDIYSTYFFSLLCAGVLSRLLYTYNRWTLVHYLKNTLLYIIWYLSDLWFFMLSVGSIANLIFRLTVECMRGDDSVPRGLVAIILR